MEILAVCSCNLVQYVVLRNDTTSSIYTSARKSVMTHSSFAKKWIYFSCSSNIIVRLFILALSLIVGLTVRAICC